MHLLNHTLFLDRDGVINQRKSGGYIENRAEFKFIPGVLEAMPIFAKHFGRIIVVTNQQGISKGIMSEEALADLHQFMKESIEGHGGRIDAIYYCPDPAYLNPICRKPNTGMALKAQEEFPEIDFGRALMVGDSGSDMEFGKRLAMTTVWIDHKEVSKSKRAEILKNCDYVLESLAEVAAEFINWKL